MDDEEDNGSLRERPIVPKSITIPKLSNNNEKQALPVLSEPRTHTVNIADGFKNENREFKQQKSHIASFADRKNQNAEPAKHVSDNIHKQKDKIKHLRQDISMISPTDGMADTGVGRAYGDPDAYETVGDGIYMMNEGEDEVKPDKMIPLASFSKPKPEKPTNRVGTVKGMKNSVSTNLKKILNKLNKQDKKFARAGNQFEKDEANALSSDETDENPVQNDVEAITPDELASIRRLENKLKAEDRQVDKVSMRKEKDDNAYGVRTDLQIKKQNKHDIQTIISRLVGEDRAFIKHNPYVVDRNNLLKKLKHIRYKDVPALKRTFPEDADSWHIKNVYNSLLKEDEEIVKNMNSPSDKKLKKFISKSAHDDDDWKIKEFLKFAENEDKEISKEKNKKLKLRDSTKAKKKNNTDVLVTNPSFAVMGSQFTSDGMPKFGNVDIEDYLYKSRPEKGDKMNMKLLKKADLHNKVSKKNSTEGAGEDRTDTFSVKENSKTVDFKSSSAKDKSKNHTNLFQSGSIMSNQTSVANCTSLNRSHNATMNQGQKRNFPTSKVPVTSNSSDFRPLKAISQQKVKFHSRNALKRNRYLKHRRHHHYKNATNEGDLNNILIRDLKRVLKKDLRSKTGKVIVTLVTDDKETTIRTDEDSNKKDKRWKATAKPSERQFLSEPDREMDHFSHMTNIVPFTVHENDAGGVEKQIFGNENFIASSVISEKGKNDIASTSFFAPTKPHAMLEDNEGEDFRPQSPSEAPPEIVQSAVKEADSKDLQDIKGVVDGDMQTTMAVFDPKSAQNKVVAFQNGLKSIDEDLFQQDHSTRENERINSFSKDSDNSKEPNNFKIVLHLPKNYNGGPEDIHGIDSNNPIGSVEQIVDKEANGGQENINVQSFSKKLEEDEEDALGKILRQPTPPPSSTAAMSTEHANENKEQNHAEQGSNEDEREQAVDVMAANGKKPENNILNLIKQNEVSLEQKLEGKSDDDVIGDLVKGYKEKNENSDKGIEANNHMSSEANSPGSFANTDQTNYNKEDESSLLSNDIFSGPSNVNPSKPKLAGSSNSKIMQPSMQFSSIKPPHPSFVQSQPAPAKPVPEVDVSKLLDQLQNPRKPDRIKVAQYTPSSINSQAQSPPSNTNTVAQQTPSDNNSPSPNKPKVNPVAQNTPSGNTSSQDQPSTVTNAAAPFAPGNMKIRIKGGQIHGGLIRGGTITGGILNGGDIEGGSILGGRVDGGKFMSGVMENGLIINGTIEGGRIKGGVIEGGSLKSGSVEGGHLKGGSVEGGALKGGEMYGGSLKSGEIDGGFLRNGSVEGGILKGGSIEGGHLLGGLMLGGHLKGGIVKSGVIKGGIIEGGVVEGGVIDDGVVIKGGKVVGASISPQYKMTATYQPQQNVHVSNYQSSNNNNEVLSPSSNQQNARQQDDSNSNEINAQQEPPSDNNILGVPESWPLKNKAHPKPDQDHKQGPGHGKEPCISNSCSFPTNNKQNRPVLLETKPGLGTSSLPKQSGSSKALQNFLKDLEKVDPDLGKPVISDNKKSHFSYKDITKKPTKTVISFKRTTDRNGVSDKKTEMPKGVNTKDITDNGR